MLWFFSSSLWGADHLSIVIHILCFILPNIPCSEEIRIKKKQNKQQRQQKNLGSLNMAQAN